jgi:hypothetical protein|tara:strand:+ start:415 stop:666 length:252 start_codon:yes stop_codon:yes gene_type:complete
VTFIAVREIITRAEASRREEQYMANGYELIIISTMRVKILTARSTFSNSQPIFSRRHSRYEVKRYARYAMRKQRGRLKELIIN